MRQLIHQHFATAMALVGTIATVAVCSGMIAYILTMAI